MWTTAEMLGIAAGCLAVGIALGAYGLYRIALWLPGDPESPESGDDIIGI